MNKPRTQPTGPGSGSKGQAKHGHAFRHSATPTYRTWMSMTGRCRNPNFSDWMDYGGRGITVCERWLVFENFLADMGERPEGCTIDRKDVNGNYEPGNCRWASNKEQGRNRRNNKRVIYQGREMTLTEFSEAIGMRVSTVSRRLIVGWTVDQVASTPLYGGYAMTKKVQAS